MRHGKKLHLSGLSDQICLITKQLADHRITFNPNEAIGRHLYTKGQWQRDNLEEAVKLLDKYNLVQGNSIAIELGANIGTQSIYLALSNKFSKIVAVEADPFNASLLRRNIEDNALEEKILSVECAIGSNDGYIQLYQNPENLGAHSVIPNGDSHNAIEVEMKSLKSILICTNTPIESVSFFWIDLEGIEFEIIRSITEFIPTLVPIYTEFTPGSHDNENTAEFVGFLESNYSYCHIFTKKGVSTKLPVSALREQNKQVDVLLFNMTN
jgi:FkbM family methyltransferase